MPRHKPELMCLKDKTSRTNDMCSCEHCTLAVCRVCGCYEGGLTTDCPGVKISQDVSEMVYKQGLDYSDEKGWYVIHAQSERERRCANFEPEAKQIIEKLSKINLGDTGAIKFLEELKKDAKYWLENPVGRR